MGTLEELLAKACGEKEADLCLSGARVFDVFSGTFREENIYLARGFILGRAPRKARETFNLEGLYLLPGFIEAHLHLESSYLMPQELGSILLSHGTTTVVCDPHEIANVLGLEGLFYLLSEARKIPLDFFFTVPSCVPASPLETPGAILSAEEVSSLLREERFIALGEMMNFPGTISRDPEVLAKLRGARLLRKPIDGHAPGLEGKELEAYRLAGPASDHECVSLEEAREKLRSGMRIFIRRGTVANNLPALLPLVSSETSPFLSFVSDDLSAEEALKEGHLDRILREAVALGLAPELALRLVTISPALYFGFQDRGGIFPGARADLVAVSDLRSFEVRYVWAQGRLVFCEGKTLFSPHPPSPPPEHPLRLPEKIDLCVPCRGARIRVIGLIPGEIVTEHLILKPKVKDGQVVPDLERDLLKIVCFERHQGTGQYGVGFVRGFGLKKGAFGSTVAHDSHQLLVVGTNDEDILLVTERLRELGGGLIVVAEGKVLSELPLPVGGLLSLLSARKVAKSLEELKVALKKLGATHPEPFMALSFLALPVIPSLKLTDRGLVDVENFSPVDLFVEE